MSAVDAACPDCLRRSLLIGRLAPRIAGLLGEPPATTEEGGPGRSDCEELIDTLSPDAERDEARRWLEELDVDAIGDDLHETGIEALCIHREPYPPALAATDDPPPVLWVLGGRRKLEDALSAPVVTVVGTRKPSPYGREMAYSLGRDLAAAGVTVVSGLALGIDAAAHRGALDGRGRPDRRWWRNGPDVPYPRTNTDLWRRLAEHGVVVSELPPGRRPYRWSFPARNRIMAAMAEVTVVVEATQPSGTLITAELRRPSGAHHRRGARAGRPPRSPRGPTGSCATARPSSATPATCWPS